MAFSFASVLAVVKKVVVPVLRIVTLGLVGTKAGRVVDVVADVTEVAAEVAEDKDAKAAVDAAPKIIDKGKKLF